MPQLSLVLTQDQTVNHVNEPSVKLILHPCLVLTELGRPQEPGLGHRQRAQDLAEVPTLTRGS